MSGVRAAILRWLGRAPSAASIRVHVLIKGRIGDGWQDVDRTLELPLGATLADLIDHAHARGIALRDAIDKSPHLRHTLMLNGERCPVDANLTRVLADGDQVYLLAPLAGG
jgi:molybdopterin converting factor small subunit